MTAVALVLGGAAVLSVNYLLLRDRLGPSIERVPLSAARGPGAGAISPGDAAARDGDALPVPAPTGQAEPTPPVPSAPLRETAVLQEDIERAALRAVLVQSTIALAITSVAALGVAWLLAGRYLAPIRDLTATARELSESTLHRRIGATGPKDEISELAESFDRMLDRLEAAFDAQRQFAANASHELRTPITMARTAVEVLAAKKAPTAGQVRSTATTVVAAVDRSERVIAGLLALARAQRGIGVRQDQRLDELVRTSLAGRAPLVLERRLAVELDLSPVVVPGDPMLLDALVGNLIDNAVKHNVADGVIRVVVVAHDAEVQLVVSNSGERLPGDAADWLFQPFRRGDATRRHGADGSGLGLAIVESIAEAHGGRAVAEPLPDGGLTVTVTLPGSGTGTAST